MATLRIPAKNLVVNEQPEVTSALATIGIDYERWSLDRVGVDAEADAVLNAYAGEIEAMKTTGGYTTADVIDVDPETPNLDALLAKFKTEHTHDEDEVRFIIAGRGIFHIHPLNNDVVSIEVEAGDMIRVPRGTRHWFDLCTDRRIRAVRWFQDKSGWTPHYTHSGVDANFEPLCFGPAYFGPRVQTSL
ncbi:MAG TPA: cupin domain-containing protein [Silvibacterium sp.]|nr:cupin domain-containing protein [Silvibacterium sp.]